MAVVSHEHRFIFLQAPGTGSATIVHTLDKLGMGKRYPPEDIVEDGRLVVRSEHTTFTQLKNKGLFDQFADFFKMVGIRNLFDWHVAQYKRTVGRRLWQIGQKDSFIYTLPPADRDALIARIRKTASMGFAANLRSIYSLDKPLNPHEAYHTDADHFIRTEHLEADLKAAFKTMNLPTDFDLTVRNVRKKAGDEKHFSDYYDDELIDFVHRANAPFFERFPFYRWENFDT